MQSLSSPKVYPIVLLLLFMACIPIFTQDPYILHVIALIGIYALYASSWNFLAYSGQASLGHAAFLGIGGFAATLLAVQGLSPWLSLLVGSAFASGIGFFVGLTCVRLKEWFLAMVTFGFAVIAQTVTHVLDRYTYAVIGFSTPPLVSSKIQYYYTVFILVVAVVFVMSLILRKTKLGLAFSAIRENELEAKTMGVNTAKYKLIAFMISTFFAGLAGALLSYFTGHISESIYNAENSFMPLIMTLIGGLGTMEGPIIGSALIVFIDEFLSFIDPTIRWICIGVFMIVVVIFLPKGISSLLRKALK